MIFSDLGQQNLYLLGDQRFSIGRTLSKCLSPSYALGSFDCLLELIFRLYFSLRLGRLTIRFMIFVFFRLFTQSVEFWLS